MDFSNFSQLLFNAQQPATTKEAGEHLKAYEQQNLGMYLTALVAEVVDESKNPGSRRLATVLLKNRLDAQSEGTRQQYHRDWLSLDANLKNNIKNGIMQTLASPNAQIRTGASEVCAKIGLIELPNQQWPTLIDTLRNNMESSNTNEALKVSSLHTLGFICEEIDPAVIGNRSNLILTAVIHGMRKEEQNDELRLAAAQALDNALEFAKQNFQNENERNYIMVVVCDSIASPNPKIRTAGYVCLVKIASLYYKELPNYMQRIFELTLETIRKDDEEVVLQAIEFWSTVCDEEIYLNEEIEEAIAISVTPKVTCHNFIKGVLKFLVPLILEHLMTKQDEDAEEDTWNRSMAGATCLTLIANCVRSEIVQYVVPFVQNNIISENWHYKEAAIMAFGSILEGTPNISAMIKEALPVLVKHMKDNHVHVKDTAAWTIGRVSQLHPLALKGEPFNHVMTALLTALMDNPRVANNACWALNNIAEAFCDIDLKPADNFNDYFHPTVSALLSTTEREDADENNLKVAAYEAINTFIQAAETPEGIEVVRALVPCFCERLAKTFVQTLSNEERDLQHETQGLLCGLLLSCTTKLEDSVSQYSDGMADLFIRVLSTKSSTVQEEALMAFGGLVNALGPKFERYMQAFRPHLLNGLSQFEDYQVCIIALGVVGDICRALEKNVLPYCDEYATYMFKHLSQGSLNKAVPHIFSCFGDIALAICGNFLKYLGVLVPFLNQVTQVKFDTSKDEMLEYQNELRESIFECYTGIIQGLRADNQQDQFFPHAQTAIDYVARIYPDTTRTDTVTKDAIALLGDLVHALGPKVKQFMSHENIKLLLEESINSEEEISDEVKWAHEVLSKN